MRLNLYQIISLVFMVFLLGFWLWLYFTGQKEGFYNYLYSFLFGLTPLIGGVIAMIQSRYWGYLQSAIGKSVFFIGLGIFLWGVGELIWSYYNFFLNEPAPYPSLADLGFAPSIFFYGLGAIFLAKATGAKYGLRNKFAKAFVIIAPFITLGIAYYVSVVVARGGVLIPPDEPPLKVLLDIAYPLGDFLALVVAVIVSGLSFKYLGGRYSVNIYAILLGLLAMYIGDTMFSYATTVGTYYNGNLGDLFLTSGTFLLTFGVLGFCTKIDAS